MNETYFEQLLQWLARCPALTGIYLSAQTARRLLELQAWVAEQSAAGFAPQLGNADPVQETLTAGAARLEQANDEGSAVYTVTLTAHYTMKWSDTFED